MTHPMPPPALSRISSGFDHVRPREVLVVDTKFFALLQAPWHGQVFGDHAGLGSPSSLMTARMLPSDLSTMEFSLGPSQLSGKSEARATGATNVQSYESSLCQPNTPEDCCCSAPPGRQVPPFQATTVV